MARIKAMLRRGQYDSEEKALAEITRGDIRIDSEKHRVYRGAERFELTAKKFVLLYVLMSHPGKVFSREALLEDVWGYDYYGGTRTVDVHIRRLREKIEVNPGEPEYILTIWGAGYAFSDHG